MLRPFRIDRMEPTEMQEFSKQMKEGGEESLASISLAISVLAVLVAMVTVLGHRSHTEAVLMQSRAGDQWNEYQAKKIRQDNLSVVVDQMTLQPSSDPKATAAKLAEYKAHIAKWNTDLAEEQTQAREFEDEVKHAEAQAGRFDLGEALLQISWCSRRSPCLPAGAATLSVALAWESWERWLRPQPGWCIDPTSSPAMVCHPGASSIALSPPEGLG